MPNQSSLRVLYLVAFIAACSALSGAALYMVKRPRPTSNAAGVHDHQATRLVKQPSQIGDGLYVLGNLSPSVVYVVETSEGLAMIDAGTEADYQKLVDAISLLQLDLKRLKMIFLTHVHYDHTMSAERLRRETGAKVYIGREDAEPLREGGPPEAFFSTFNITDVTLHQSTVDGELVDGQVFTLGEARITAIATPGHTHGSFCYLIEHRNQRALCTGDTVMTLTDGQGTYSTYLPPLYRGDAEQYLATLKRLREMPKPDLVLPGHPASDKFAPNPRLSPAQWQELIDRSIAEMEQLTERYAQDGADFLDGTPKELTPGLFYLGNAGQYASYALVSEKTTALFGAASASDPTEFLSVAWKALELEPPPVAAVLLTSCKADHVVGLQKLVEETGCRVIASPAGAEALSRKLPDVSVSTLDDLPSLAAARLQMLATPGLDPTAAAYDFHWGEVEVVVTGSLPLDIDAALREVSSPERIASSVPELKASHEALERLHPSLWLSAHPYRGRNANLYDDHWQKTVARSGDWIMQALRSKNLLP